MVKSEIFAIEKIIKNFPNPKLGIGKFFNYFYDQGVSCHMKKEFENGFLSADRDLGSFKTLAFC